MHVIERFGKSPHALQAREVQSVAGTLHYPLLLGEVAFHEDTIPILRAHFAVEAPVPPVSLARLQGVCGMVEFMATFNACPPACPFRSEETCSTEDGTCKDRLFAYVTSATPPAVPCTCTPEERQLLDALGELDELCPGWQLSSPTRDGSHTVGACNYKAAAPVLSLATTVYGTSLLLALQSMLSEVRNLRAARDQQAAAEQEAAEVAALRSDIATMAADGIRCEEKGGGIHLSWLPKHPAAYYTNGLGGLTNALSDAKRWIAAEIAEIEGKLTALRGEGIGWRAATTAVGGVSYEVWLKTHAGPFDSRDSSDGFGELTHGSHTQLSRARAALAWAEGQVAERVAAAEQRIMAVHKAGLIREPAFPATANGDGIWTYEAEITQDAASTYWRIYARSGLSRCQMAEEVATWAETLKPRLPSVAGMTLVECCAWLHHAGWTYAGKPSGGAWFTASLDDASTIRQDENETPIAFHRRAVSEARANASKDDRP